MSGGVIYKVATTAETRYRLQCAHTAVEFAEEALVVLKRERAEMAVEHMKGMGSQREVGEVLGVPQSVVSRMMTGRVIGRVMVERILAAGEST